MLLVIPLSWFFLFKIFNQGTWESEDFFFQIADGFSSTKGSFWVAGVFLLCAKISPKGIDLFTTILGLSLIFTINNPANDVVVKLYDFNAQLQTVLNLIHPVIVHSSLYLTLLFLFKPKTVVSFYAWFLAGAALLLGSIWAFTELGWGSFWFYDPIENYSFLYWVLLSSLIPSHIKKYTPRFTLISALIFFLIYPKFFLNNSLHSFNEFFFFGNQLSNNFLTVYQPIAVLISATLLMLASSRVGTKRQTTKKNRIIKTAFALTFIILFFFVVCLLVPTLEDANISRVALISTAIYLLLTKNKNHNEIGFIMLIVLILETWNTSEVINKPEFIFLKIDELASQNHVALTNNSLLKQMLVDNNKKQSLLETKEIYYYSIVGYAESDSAGTALVVGPYTLSIAHITSKIIKGL